MSLWGTDRIYKMDVPAFAKQIQEDHQLPPASHHTRDEEVEKVITDDLTPDIGKRYLLLIATVNMRHIGEYSHASTYSRCGWLTNVREPRYQPGRPETYRRGPSGIKLLFDRGPDAGFMDPLTLNAENSPQCLVTIDQLWVLTAHQAMDADVISDDSDYLGH